MLEILPVDEPSSTGELVGINGRHAYPLWEAPDYYEDGREIDPNLQQIVNTTSWASNCCLNI